MTSEKLSELPNHTILTIKELATYAIPADMQELLGGETITFPPGIYMITLGRESRTQVLRVGGVEEN